MPVNSKDSMYSWHLSLRVDRPVEVSCRMRGRSGAPRGLVRCKVANLLDYRVLPHLFVHNLCFVELVVFCKEKDEVRPSAPKYYITTLARCLPRIVGEILHIIAEITQKRGYSVTHGGV